MARVVGSYVADAWYTAPDEGTTILDAATGEPVASVSSTGIDFAQVVEHARTVGGPALRSLTFQQRALLLKKLAAYLQEHSAAIYEPYPTSGSTQADARVDVEGGIHALGVYAKKALKELPNDTIYVEGTPERLGKNFQGQTIYTPRRGVAVFINAFNFPVWGFLEKLCTALLAGAPMIVKPATPTAHLAEAAFRVVVDSGVLPPGAVQLIAGSVGNLLDCLGGQDHIAFTGSGATAAVLRSHPAVVERGATFNSESDSLNATILGPDVTTGSDEFTAFVKRTVSELTSKTGQKCTAIRRALVPAAQVDDVVAALRARLDKVVVGDPRNAATTMGPLGSRAQATEINSAVQVLRKGADVVIGDPDAPATVASGDVSKGAFFAPTVLVASDVGSPQLHQTEAFGPVATVFGYRDLAEAAALTALGEGSLAASVISQDPAVVRTLVEEIAPYHGRILVVDKENAATAMPHGAVLPQLIHGGPGRAGGGEELGGLRGVLRLMQATSVSASPTALVSLTQTWNSDAKPLVSDVHPFRKYLEDLQIGDSLFTGSRLITLEDIEHFANFTGDTFYAHMNEEAAKASPLFKGRVAHGYFVIAAAAGLFVDPDPGPVLANFGLEHLLFVQPVYPGDSIKLRLTVKHKAERPGSNWGEVTWDVEVTNQNDEPVATYDLLTINAMRPAG